MKSKIAKQNFKVKFIVGGAQKGGTTALDKYLREHPEITMARRKEVHFFDNENNFLGPLANYVRYHKQFKSRTVNTICGEATPIYMYWDRAIERIWRYNSEMKIVLVLRNPIERAYSHWNMERSRGADSLDFSTAIRVERDRCRAALPLRHRVYSYVDRGYYSEQIRRIWRFFPKQQVLVIKNEDLKQSPNNTMGKVFSFLEIAPITYSENIRVHETSYIQNISNEDREYLQKLFFNEIEVLENLLDWDCTDWKSY